MYNIIHLPLFSYVGFTMNRTAFGVVTPKMCGTTIEIHHEQYMTTSLEHVVRFLDVLQSPVDTACIHKQLQELALVEEEEEGEPPPPEQQLLMGLIERSLHKKLDDIMRHLTAVERALDGGVGGVATL